MSTVLVVTPILIANWSVITAAVTAGISAAGFTMIQGAIAQSSTQERTDSTTTREEIEVEDSEILGDAVSTTQQIVVQRDGVRGTFTRDPRGALRLCMEGKGHSKSQLREIGEELLGRVTQQYAYHRIVSELKNRNMTIVEEQVTEQNSVKIRVRNW